MNFNGEDTFYFYLTDNKSGYNSLTGRVLIKVNAINDPPLSFNKVVNTLENEPIDITLKSADAENDEMTLAIEKPPSHGNVSDINQLTHMVTYTQIHYSQDPITSLFRQTTERLKGRVQISQLPSNLQTSQYLQLTGKEMYPYLPTVESFNGEIIMET